MQNILALGQLKKTTPPRPTFVRDFFIPFDRRPFETYVNEVLEKVTGKFLNEILKFNSKKSVEKNQLIFFYK